MLINKLAIVILNYRCSDLTINCVKNLIHFNQDLRIVIVDNNSQDQSLAILTTNFINNPNITIIKSEVNLGYSHGNNTGARFIDENLKGIEYIGILNPDVTICSNTVFDKLLLCLEEDVELAAIAPLVFINNTFKTDRLAFKTPKGISPFLTSFSTICKFFNPYDYKKFTVKNNYLTYVDAIPGSFFVIKAEIFKQINYFDEKTFLYFEELILAEKIKKAGYKTGLLFSCYYNHDHTRKRITLSYLISDYKRYLKSLKYYNSEYLSWGKLNNILLSIFYPVKLLELSLHALKCYFMK